MCPLTENHKHDHPLHCVVCTYLNVDTFLPFDFYDIVLLHAFLALLFVDMCYVLYSL